MSGAARFRYGHPLREGNRACWIRVVGWNGSIEFASICMFKRMTLHGSPFLYEAEYIAFVSKRRPISCYRIGDMRLYF
jgi:hypothetical protein